jgi:hypothetical protein
MIVKRLQLTQVITSLKHSFAPSLRRATRSDCSLLRERSRPSISADIKVVVAKYVAAFTRRTEVFTARHRALAVAITEPLRSQLVALVRAHKTGEAVRQYQEASGLDYRMSMFVIDDLAHEGRP